MSLTFFSYLPRIMLWLSEQDLSPVSRVILMRWSLAFKADMLLAQLPSLARCIVILGQPSSLFLSLGRTSSGSVASSLVTMGTRNHTKR
jgi:hypothetical protein